MKKNIHTVILGRRGGKAGTGKAKARTSEQVHRAALIRHNKAFTLIELLVVITIIAILAGMITSILINSKERAREATARDEVKGLETVFKQYLDVNKVWDPVPPPTIFEGTVYPLKDDQAKLFTMISGIYEFKTYTNALMDKTTAYDPWADYIWHPDECYKHIYYVMFDANYDNTITVNGQDIHRSVIVWSPGKNGYNNNFGSDDGIASWK